jgi:hypothetical protein
MHEVKRANTKIKAKTQQSASLQQVGKRFQI